MKLLILTQKVDCNDDVLGFFHRWLEVFSHSFEYISVICLGKGNVALPENVKVFSLGKEKKVSRLKYLLNFYSYIWQQRNNYDVVLVHMNKEYVVMGSLFWRLWGKKVFFWYNHTHGTFSARLAGLLADKIFYTSSYSFFSNSKKAVEMPVGVDMEQFKPHVATIPENAVLFLSRISPVKNLEILIEAAEIWDRETTHIPVHVYGNALLKDEEYFSALKKKAEPLIKKSKIIFHGSIPNAEAPNIYRKYAIVANLTQSGSFDKTIIEAMASGTLVIASNKSFEDLLPTEYHTAMVFEEKNAHAFAQKVAALVRLTPEEKAKIGAELRELVMNKHSVEHLSKRIVEESKA
jgi:glycosyltransferase involved in cell wall biosynthesis